MKKIIVALTFVGLLIFSGYVFVNKIKLNEQTYKGTFVHFKIENKSGVLYGYLY